MYLGREGVEEARRHNMITIQKNDDGKWEWERIEKDGKVTTTGPFDTIEKCKADIKKCGLDKEPVVKVGAK